MTRGLTFSAAIQSRAYVLPALVLQSTDSQADLETERYVAHHVHEFLLHELIRGQWSLELLPLQSVRSRDL